jgi:hypothetical protein
MNPTEADVIRAAIKQIQKRDGFTTSAYFHDANGNYMELAEVNGKKVAATCAIGGIEHAIFQLTNEIISEDERRTNAQLATPRSRAKTGALGLYVKTMRRINRLARELYPTDVDGDKNTTVEELTFYGSDAAAKQRVRKVFKAALEEAESA